MNHSHLRKNNKTQRLEPDLESVTDDELKGNEIMWAALQTSIRLHSQHITLTLGGSLATQVALNQTGAKCCDIHHWDLEPSISLLKDLIKWSTNV